MFSQSLTILTVLTAALPLTHTQQENTKLDILKADILTHVIEKEKNNEETDTALQILQFILGNKQGNSRTEWVAAKDLIRRDNNELYKSSEDEIDDFIGLYEDNLYDYSGGTEEFEYPDLFTGQGETDYSNVFEYSDLFTSNGDIDDDYEYYQELGTDSESEDYFEFEEDNEDYFEELEGDWETVIDLENEEYDYTETCSADTDSSSNSSFSVTESLPYIMTGQDSSNSATIVLQRISQLEDKVNLKCNFSSSVSSLLSDSGCLPEIYLVSGHSSCSSLPQSVTAKKLAEIHQTGAGQTLVDLSWSELTNTCVIIVRKKSCDDSEDVVVADSTEIPEDTTSVSFRDTCEQLRLVPATLFRTFTTINLSGFNILLSGSTARTINIASLPSGGTLSFGGVTVTNHNTFSTLPLLQLPGLNGATAVTIAISMYIAYYGAALLAARSVNNRSRISADSRQLLTLYLGEAVLRRRLGSQYEEQDPLISHVDTTIHNINKYWSRIKQNIGLGGTRNNFGKYNRKIRGYHRRNPRKQ